MKKQKATKNYCNPSEGCKQNAESEERGLHQRLTELGYEKVMEIYSDAGEDPKITREYRQSIGDSILDNLRLKIRFAIIPAELVPEAASVGTYLPHTCIFYQIKTKRE
ncbi:hypothetical protein J4402_02035 [Candidatus Pacearchaeota archaeon]|nr:hypothetical protein [uncultured archaeon]AQS31841.1 hypothetical protein [uncultured archaeon]MBS3088537.1 hypothetical protein [Candidatus Pacearchaeota archaeon]